MKVYIATIVRPIEDWTCHTTTIMGVFENLDDAIIAAEKYGYSEIEPVNLVLGCVWASKLDIDSYDGSISQCRIIERRVK